ncbi:hypothetical protein ACPPVQ_04345 [Diaminobutyricibacter sp. McL0618]|uniref:hypothetical protein n=1 Tax=Leifsonia sp. McL0618 TaxID=3415677 RepID=UPI003CF53DD9
MKRPIAIISATALVAVGLLLTGCSDPSPAPSADPTTSSPAPTSTPDNGPTILAFGENMTYKDGVAITVSAPEAYTPPSYDVGATHPPYVIFTLTITNGSSENLSPLASPQVSSAGGFATQILHAGDAGGPVAYAPTDVILPGGSVTWQEAFAVNDASQLTLQVSPEPITYTAVVYTNTK